MEVGFKLGMFLLQFLKALVGYVDRVFAAPQMILDGQMQRYLIFMRSFVNGF